MTPAPPPPPRADREDERLSALRRYRILDSGSDVDFDDIAAIAAQLTASPVALVSLVDEGRAWFKARVGLEVSEAPRDVAFCSWAVVDPGSPLQVPDLAQDERFRDNPLVAAPGGFRAYTGVPLVSSDGHALGTVCVLDHQPRELPPEQVESLQRLARAAMSHIEARRVTHALLSVTDVLDAVRGLARCQDMESLGQAASTLLARVLDSDVGALRLPFDDDVRPHGQQLRGGNLVLTGSSDGPGSVLHLPLVRGGELLGVLTTCWPWTVTGVDPTAERVLDVLAHETAHSLGALRDRRRMQVAADTDPLTGLANRRTGEARLRQWPQACIAVVDLDHFKVVNDTHGHAAGDALLRTVAVSLARHARSDDLVCRWGGEEFVVALEQASSEVLWQLLERVRADLAADPAAPTFSAGLATREPDEPVRGLLKRADAALYAAKAAGRARTVAAQGRDASSRPLGR